MTLRLRLLLVLVGIVAGGLIVSDVVTYTSLQSFLAARLDQQLAAAPGPVSRALQICLDQHESGFQACKLSGDTAVLPGTYGELRDSTGTVLLSACFFNDHTARLADLPAPLPLSTGGTARTSTFFAVSNTGCGAHSYEGVASSIVLNDSPGLFVVVVALPLTDENDTLTHLLRQEGLVSAAVLIVLGSLSWWIVRRGLRPLDEMATTAGAIAGGDLTQRVAGSESHTEVGRLGVALNTMLSEIEVAFAARAASEERLRRFLADASHELRTPLTSIRGYAEIFDRGARDRPEDLATSMRHIRGEANRMSELVDDLLLLARLDRERPLEHEQVELTAVVAAAVDAGRVKAPDRHITFSPGAPVIVVGDANRLRQVADNLVANAIAHTPAGSPIAVDVRAEGDTALLTVADRGPGIPPEERVAIFEPFHRADPSRARTTGGVGLGLAIVSAIAVAHGGTVGVDSPAPPPVAPGPDGTTPDGTTGPRGTGPRGTGPNGTGRDGTGPNGTGRDGAGQDGTGPGATFWVRLPLARLDQSRPPVRPDEPAPSAAGGPPTVP